MKYRILGRLAVSEVALAFKLLLQPTQELKKGLSSAAPAFIQLGAIYERWTRGPLCPWKSSRGYASYYIKPSAMLRPTWCAPWIRPITPEYMRVSFLPLAPWSVSLSPGPGAAIRSDHRPAYLWMYLWSLGYMHSNTSHKAPTSPTTQLVGTTAQRPATPAQSPCGHIQTGR